MMAALLERTRLGREVLARRVGGAQDDLAQPGHTEQDPAIRRPRHSSRRGLRAGFPVHHEVHALARRDHRLHRAADRLAVLLAELVHPHAVALITHRASARDAIPVSPSRHRARDLPLLVAQTRSPRIVDQERRRGSGGARQRHASRASSNWPSQYLTPPFNPCARAVGRQARVWSRVRNSVGPRPAFPARASYILRPSAIEGRLPEACDGMTKGSGCARWARCEAASCARAAPPGPARCCPAPGSARRRVPVWWRARTLPLAKSCASTSTTEKPLAAASSAHAQPGRAAPDDGHVVRDGRASRESRDFRFMDPILTDSAGAPARVTAKAAIDWRDDKHHRHRRRGPSPSSAAATWPAPSSAA